MWLERMRPQKQAAIRSNLILNHADIKYQSIMWKHLVLTDNKPTEKLRRFDARNSVLHREEALPCYRPEFQSDEISTHFFFQWFFFRCLLFLSGT